MNVEAIVTTYGYPALFGGALLEGETVVIAAGLLAHRGYLHLPLVILVACVAVVIGDQFYFHVGRRGGARFFAKFPKYAAPLDRACALLARHPTGVVLGMRFLYGFRVVTPIAVGMSGFSPVRFLLLDICGALLWATLIGTVGYVFGVAMENVLEDARRHEALILLVLALIALAAFFLRHFRRRAPGK